METALWILFGAVVIIVVTAFIMWVVERERAPAATHHDSRPAECPFPQHAPQRRRTSSIVLIALGIGLVAIAAAVVYFFLIGGTWYMNQQQRECCPQSVVMPPTGCCVQPVLNRLATCCGTAVAPVQQRLSGNYSVPADVDSRLTSVERRTNRLEARVDNHADALRGRSGHAAPAVAGSDHGRFGSWDSCMDDMRAAFGNEIGIGDVQSAEDVERKAQVRCDRKFGRVTAATAYDAVAPPPASGPMFVEPGGTPAPVPLVALPPSGGPPPPPPSAAE